MLKTLTRLKREDRDRAGRRALGAARALVIYGLLLGGSAAFALPFLWMIGTSFKVDREMFADKITLWPRAPVPRSASPYLDERYFHKPAQPAYKRAGRIVEQAIAGMPLPVPAGTRGIDRAASILARGVFLKLASRLPAAVWERPPEALKRAVAEAVTAGLVAETAEEALRRLTFGQVRVRSFDVQEVDVTRDGTVAGFWSVEGGRRAELIEAQNASAPRADLFYAFDGNGEDTIRLTSSIELPFAADRLFRVQIFIRPDDSWNALEFYVEKNGRRYRGQKREYLGNFQWTSFSLQEFVDKGKPGRPDIGAIRLWNVMREVDRGPGFENRPDRIRVEIVMRRSSLPRAWWAKCSRNYRGALDYIPFWRYASTSAFLVILNVLATVFSCSLVAYAFARLRWPGRNFCFALMLATMMIPPQVTMIPYFLIVRHLGWYNTLTPLWIPSLFANAFSVFLLRQFMKGIPRDLEDAARMDGCNFMQIYWYVMLPLVKPTLACIAIFTFMGVWNDFMGPLIYLSDQRLYPLSLGLYAFNVQTGGSYGMMMAGSLLMTLPVIVVFFFAQKYFIQGVTLTGMKG